VGTGVDVLVEQPTYDPLLGICQLIGARARRFGRRAANEGVAAHAVTMAILANTLVKLRIALVLGRGRFQPLAGAGLALIVAALMWWW
jgi:hypothetical protein